MSNIRVLFLGVIGPKELSILCDSVLSGLAPAGAGVDSVLLPPCADAKHPNVIPGLLPSGEKAF